jgi:hypothetical protein
VQARGQDAFWRVVPRCQSAALRLPAADTEMSGYLNDTVGTLGRGSIEPSDRPLRRGDECQRRQLADDRQLGALASETGIRYWCHVHYDRGRDRRRQPGHLAVALRTPATHHTCRRVPGIRQESCCVVLQSVRPMKIVPGDIERRFEQHGHTRIKDPSHGRRSATSQGSKASGEKLH